MTSLREYLIDEFVEDYLEKHMGRREALGRLAAITGSMAAATSLLAACAPQPEPPAAPTATSAPAVPTATTVPSGPNVSATDPDLIVADITFPASDGTMIMAHLARPKSGSPAPPVLVCQENQGLTEHIKDVTRRVAKSGFVALGVDLLSRQGGTEKAAAAGPVQGFLGNANTDLFIGDFQSGLKYLNEQTFVKKGKAGMVGFCFGGGITWRVATKTPEIVAAVPFYGPPPALEDLAGIQGSVLAIYGETDANINRSIPDVEAKMKELSKPYEKIIYPGAGHGFNNDTRATGYNATAGKDAWEKTMAFFNKHLMS